MNTPLTTHWHQSIIATEQQTLKTITTEQTIERLPLIYLDATILHNTQTGDVALDIKYKSTTNAIKDNHHLTKAYTDAENDITTIINDLAQTICETLLKEQNNNQTTQKEKKP